jgi:hypothetical protein
MNDTPSIVDRLKRSNVNLADQNMADRMIYINNCYQCRFYVRAFEDRDCVQTGLVYHICTRTRPRMGIVMAIGGSETYGIEIPPWCKLPTRRQIEVGGDESDD